MATILCVDDDPVILELYRSLLQSKGYDVFCAQDGPTGIALALKHVLDLVVLDIDMPGMDGHEVAGILRAERPSLPVVILSGSPDETPGSLKWFADALLHKGDGPAALLAAIDRILNKGSQSLETPTSTKPALLFNGRTNEPWMEFAALASKEKDPKKLLELVSKINELLGRRYPPRSAQN